MRAGSPARIEVERLGRYRLLQRIGGGATSLVFAAHDEATDRQVALKMIVADLEDEKETRERFYREAKVTAELLHPNIVTVLDVGEDQGHPYIVMELLDGWPLGEYLSRETSRPLALNLGLIRQLCSGLQAAHECGVVHRDIKPSNLFVQRNGALKILDFGLAKLQASTLTAMGQIVGTPDFMSPEQAAGEKVDARSDIFSAAAVSYLILTGRAPFTGPDLRRTLDALLHQHPAPMTDAEAPAPLREVLEKGLAKNPARRYQSSAEMLRALEAVRP
jgi:eukaryotic-like serine/threonine-protein kinase